MFSPEFIFLLKESVIFSICSIILAIVFEDTTVNIYKYPSDRIHIMSRDNIKKTTLGELITKVDRLEQLKIHTQHLNEYIQYTLILARKYDELENNKKQSHKYLNKFRWGINLRVDRQDIY